MESFFDHYRGYIELAEETVINFCTGNGDHILNYRGRDGCNATFDWARYNAYCPQEHRRKCSHNWVKHVREGGETGGNPAWSGPSFLVSDEPMDYHRLQGIYQAFRDVAKERGVAIRLLEYFEPGPEFCRSIFKDKHQEVMSNGVMDVTAPLAADTTPYASSPGGIAEGMIAGDFLAEQCGVFVRDFKLDGVYLGNQCGLIGFWHPCNAPEVTPERRAGILQFFKSLWHAVGKDRLLYWMDTYWPADVEIDRWAMSEEACATGCNDGRQLRRHCENRANLAQYREPSAHRGQARRSPGHPYSPWISSIPGIPTLCTLT